MAGQKWRLRRRRVRRISDCVAAGNLASYHARIAGPRWRLTWRVRRISDREEDKR
jgi:hypothetical protein